ncbi:MAG TPA: mercuric transporter MerT family protein [Pirellulales bacterium]|nr:mercuric transporter MerT family protein [Pirellulales bacterium]
MMANIGAVVAAIMASSCCWLPLVLMAVGVSGAGMSAVLEAYRPLFIVVTFGFLATAFYFTYRPKRAVTGHDCRAVEPSAASAVCCGAPPPEGRSFSIVSFNKLLLWAVALFAVAFMFFPRSLESLLGMPAPCCACGNNGGNETKPCCPEAVE